MRKALAGLGIAALVAASLISGASASAKPSDDTAGIQAFGQPVINEIATRGPVGDLDQFVEVANPNMVQAWDISNYQLRVYNAANVLIETVFIPVGTVLQPLGSGSPDASYWVISSPGFTGGFADQPGAITVDIPDNGGVALFNPGGAKVDGVALSSAVFNAVEGIALTPQSPTFDLFAPAYGRDLLSSDINNNRVDFKLLVRTPDSPN